MIIRTNYGPIKEVKKKKVMNFLMGLLFSSLNKQCIDPSKYYSPTFKNKNHYKI